MCRSRRGRVRTVPSSRANSSKQSRVDPSESSGQSKRSRSASEEPWDSSTAASGLEIRGSESQIHRETEPYSSPSHHSNRPRRLTKVGNRSYLQSIWVTTRWKIYSRNMAGCHCIQAHDIFMIQFAGDKKLLNMSARFWLFNSLVHTIAKDLLTKSHPRLRRWGCCELGLHFSCLCLLLHFHPTPP